MELACRRELWGHFYWLGLPGLLKHPNRHYLLVLCNVQTIIVQGIEAGRTGRVNKGKPMA